MSYLCDLFFIIIFIFIMINTEILLFWNNNMDEEYG